jgi:hypothetical protein
MGAKAYFQAAIAVALLSGGGYWAYHHGRLPDWYWEAKLPENIAALDVTDTAKLKHVLFSGEPWLLQCYSGIPFEGQHLPRPYRVHKVFQESLGSLKGIVQGGVLDCEKRLPSNKSLVEKFGFVRRSQPLLVLAAGGVKPRQIPAKDVGSAYGVVGFVKPKAEAKVHKVSTQKTLEAVCGGRRPCLITRLPSDSVVLDLVARKFRTVEVVTLGEDEKKVQLSWGRGEEVGETLEEEEAQHFGKRVSFLKYDPEAPRERKGAKPPRLLRGFTCARRPDAAAAPPRRCLPAAPLRRSPATPLRRHRAAAPAAPAAPARPRCARRVGAGRRRSPASPWLRRGEEDLPSLSRFLQSALEATDGFMSTPMPKVSVPAREKKAREKTANDNAEVQARRAKQRAAARAKEEAEQKARQEAWEAQMAAKKLTAEEMEEKRREREAQRRAEMEAEAQAANDILEEVDEEEDDGYEAETEEEDYSEDTLDLDA